MNGLRLRRDRPVGVRRALRLSDSRRIVLGAQENEIVVHHVPAVGPVAVRHELVLERPRMDEDDVHVARLSKLEGLPGPYGDDVDLAIVLLLKRREEHRQEAGILRGGRGGHPEPLFRAGRQGRKDEKNEDEEWFQRGAGRSFLSRWCSPVNGQTVGVFGVVVEPFPEPVPAEFPDDPLSIGRRQKFDETAREFRVGPPIGASKGMIGVHDERIPAKEDLEMGEIPPDGDPRAAVRHEIPTFVVRPFERRQHERFRHDVPVAGRGEARLPPDLHLFPMRPGVVPPGEKPGLRIHNPGERVHDVLRPGDLRRVVRRPHNEILVGADEGLAVRPTFRDRFLLCGGRVHHDEVHFAVPQEVQRLPGPRLDPAQGRVLTGDEDVRQRGEQPELSRAAGGQREGAPAGSPYRASQSSPQFAPPGANASDATSVDQQNKNGHGFSFRLDERRSAPRGTGGVRTRAAPAPASACRPSAAFPPPAGCGCSCNPPAPSGCARRNSTKSRP